MLRIGAPRGNVEKTRRAGATSSTNLLRGTDGAIEFLAADAPIPSVGDILLLQRNITGDTEAQAFVMGGLLAPFRVVDREHLYGRPLDEKHDPINTKPAEYSKTWIWVVRVSKEDYFRDPGRSS